MLLGASAFANNKKLANNKDKMIANLKVWHPFCL